jgi:diacylglycerol kinase (ATP)
MNDERPADGPSDDRRSATRDVVVVVNAHSRRTGHDLKRIHGLLAAHGIGVAEFHVVRNHDELQRQVTRSVRGGAQAILVGGGDGTMAMAVDALAHRGAILGVLPLGTGNSFAQSLGIDPHDLDAAVAVVARGYTQCIDLGRVNGTYFANFATIGLSSEIAGATSSRAKAWTGPLAYALAAVRPLLSHGAFRARVRWKRGTLDLRTQDIIVANGRFFGSTPVTPDATITDGKLVLFTTSDPSALGALRTYLAFGMHRQTKLRNAHVVSAKGFVIRARPKQMISIDGSLLENTPARFRVASQALRVFVPEQGVAHG